MLRSFSIFLVILFLFSPSCYSQDKIVTASVDKVKVKTAEVFTYRVEIKGIFSSPKITLPEFNDFRVVSQSQSKNYSFKDGKAQLILKLTIKMFAANPGIFTISKVIVEDDGESFESDPITIEVRGKPLPGNKRLPQGIGKGVEI